MSCRKSATAIRSQDLIRFKNPIAFELLSDFSFEVPNKIEIVLSYLNQLFKESNEK